MNDETRIFLEALQQRLIHDTVRPDCPLRREVIGVVGSPAITRPFITTLSDTPVRSRPESIYGSLSVGESGAVLQLFGTGARQDVSALREVAQKRALGFIVLANGINPSSLRIAEAQLAALEQFAPDKLRLIALLNAETADGLDITPDDLVHTVSGDDAAAVREIVLRLTDLLLET